jgi:ribosome-associated toxin RatA of RatAB toxin-antitoxin module
MFTENNIIINGSAKRVFDLASDVLMWPVHLPHYRWVRLVKENGGSRVVEMAAHRDGIPVKWTSILEPLPHEKKIIFRHIKGPTKGMYVEWIISQNGQGWVDVRITHEFYHPWPIIGPFIGKYVIGKFFVHNIAGKTLRRIKQIVETETEAVAV